VVGSTRLSLPTAAGPERFVRTHRSTQTVLFFRASARASATKFIARLKLMPILESLPGAIDTAMRPAIYFHHG
jgi:hypothetical protein